jgi:RNA polymerase sigma-70 factor (ECF subfamily)
VVRQRRIREALVNIEEIEDMPAAARNGDLDQPSALIRRLKPLDRQVIVCYLEGMDAAATAEITGLSAANVAMKVHRIKNLLRRMNSL